MRNSVTQFFHQTLFKSAETTASVSLAWAFRQACEYPHGRVEDWAKYYIRKRRTDENALGV